MKELSIVSGKGGTGKTSVTAALAALAGDLVLCDNDVDAANLHLLAAPSEREHHVFMGGWQAHVDEESCSACGLCADNCHFDAFVPTPEGKYQVVPSLCEGCRLCERLCPEQAISSAQSDNNQWFVSDSRFGTVLHARMGPGEENSGKLVSTLRKKARELALQEGRKWILNDGPPGIGCATIASLTGADAVLVVVEASRTGWHDAKRVITLAQGFHLPVFILINKADIHPGITAQIELEVAEAGLPLLGKLSFDRTMVEAMLEGLTLTEYAPESEGALQLQAVWQGLVQKLDVATS